MLVANLYGNEFPPSSWLAAMDNHPIDRGPPSAPAHPERQGFQDARI